MNVFFAFYCLCFFLPRKKFVCLEYVVASRNADCALLFDGLICKCNPMVFNLQIPSFIVAFLRVRRWVVRYAFMQFRHVLYKQ